jgi:hypothetical protein
MAASSKRGRIMEDAEEDVDSISRLDPEETAKYAGKYIAIWKKEIIGSGKTGSEARREAKKKIPDSNPTIAAVPPFDSAFIGTLKIVR